MSKKEKLYWDIKEVVRPKYWGEIRDGAGRLVWEGGYHFDKHEAYKETAEKLRKLQGET